MAKKTFLDGKKKDKDSLIFEVLGDLDEASSALGLVKVVAKKEVKKLLTLIQQDLFDISSLIASCGKKDIKKRLDWLNSQIKQREKKRISKRFILPGKNELESRLHLARAIVRRGERKTIALSKKQEVSEEILDYLNHLSWLLFLLAINN